MKKVITILAVAVMSTFTAFAQQTSIGVTGGFAHSWLSDTDDQKFNPTGNIGGTFIYSTAQHWGFGFDIKYSREGAKSEYTLGFPINNTYTQTLALDYIRVPLRATYFFNDYEHNIRPKISLAPTLGFLTGATYHGKDDDGNKNSSTVTDNFNVFDFGITGAVGANFRMSDRIWLTTELAYYNGFLNISKDDSDDDNIMNRNFALNVGLTFGIGQ